MSKRFHLFYVHGFNSSPQSAKAQLLKRAVINDPQIEFHVPTLGFDPENAIAVLCKAIEACLPDPIGLVGSSMGGFYGTWVAEKYDLPLVMINPAVRPYELLADHLGEVENEYTGEKFTFTLDHVDVFKKLEVTQLSKPERYLLLTQTADEVLDYRQGVAKYAASKQMVEQGGSHGFDNFEEYIPTIFEFFNL